MGFRVQGGWGLGGLGQKWVKKSRKKENESSAKQVKVRGRDRNPHAERETKKKKLGKKPMK